MEPDDATGSGATPPVSASTAGSVEDLSDVWLWQAVAQLVQSFGGGAERSLRAMMEGRYDDRPGVAYFNARLTGARLSMMFSAFAAAAYINRFLHNRLSGRDLETALRIRPPAEKFAAGTRLALGQTLFRATKTSMSGCRSSSRFVIVSSMRGHDRSSRRRF